VLQIIDQNSSLDKQIIEIWKSGNKFEFLLEVIRSDFFSGYSSIFDTCKLASKTTSYSFLKDSLDSTSTDFSKEKMTGKLTSIIESNETQTIASYFRIVQPLTKNAEIGFLEESVNLQTDVKSSYIRGLNRMTINREEVEAFRLEIDEKKFLIIDSCSTIDFERFRNITDSFFAAYAFIFGETVGEESYFLSSSDNNFENIHQIIFLTRPSSFVSEFPIYFNMHKGKLVLFPKNVFEAICNNYLSKEQYSRTLKILDEAFLSSFALSKCILYAAALETIATLINKDKEKPKPVSEDRLLKGDLIEKIKELITKDIYLINDEKKFLIEKKMQYWNSPTNIDKTREAFKNYGIELPASLKKTIKYRDTYFHGSIPDGIRFDFELDNKIRAEEMHFLINILLLKYSGYSGNAFNKTSIIEYDAVMRKSLSDSMILKQSKFLEI
jgi:hypothetical protein